MAKAFNTEKAHELVANGVRMSLVVPDGTLISGLDTEGTHLLTQPIEVSGVKTCMALLKLEGKSRPYRCRFDVGLDDWSTLEDFPPEMSDINVKEI